MRTLSIKSVTATLTLAALLTLAVPAHARPAQPRPGESFARSIRVLMNRVLGAFTSNGLPTTPIPAPPAAEPVDSTGLPTTPIPAVPDAERQ